VGERGKGRNSIIAKAPDKLFSLSTRQRGERGGVRGEYLKKMAFMLVYLKMFRFDSAKLFRS